MLGDGESEGEGDYGDDDFEEEFESVRESSTAVPAAAASSSQLESSQPPSSKDAAAALIQNAHASPARAAQVSSSASEEVESLRAELREARAATAAARAEAAAAAAATAAATAAAAATATATAAAHASSPVREPPASSSGPETMESLRAECDQWRQLHAADLDWLAQSCRVIMEDPRARRPGGAVAGWRGLAGAAAIAGGGKRGGKQGGGGRGVASRPQQPPLPRAAGAARSEGSLAPEVMQVAEVLRCVAEIRAREAGRRTNVEELVLAVEAMLVRIAKAYAGGALMRRKLERKPPAGAPAQASPPGAAPRAAAAATAATGPARTSPQSTEARALRQRLARLQSDNQRLTEQLVDARQLAAYGDAPAEELRLPSLVPGGVRAVAQDGASRSNAPSQPNRPEIAGVPDRQSKPRPRPGGGAAAAGSSEREEPAADPHRRRVPPAASKSELAAAESRLAEAVAHAEWSEEEVAARMDELGASSPFAKQ